MGIIKFNNVPSTTPGLEVETFPNYVAPEKEYQVTHVPGRNGDLVVDTKNYKNVPRPYKVSMAVEPPAVSVSGSTASFEATAERALAECKTAISSDVGKVGTTIINSATDPVENNEPYNFRAVPNGVGDRENDTLIGGTVAWNQLEKTDASTSTVGSITFTNLGNGKVRVTGTFNGTRSYKYTDTVNEIPARQNDIILFLYSGDTLPSGCEVFFGYYNGSTWLSGEVLTSTKKSVINKLPANITKIVRTGFDVSVRVPTGTVLDYTVSVNIFNLTQMFGSTIADYIYGLETATTGAGVAWFRNLFPKDYYAYNAGELMSVKTEAHKTTGKNLLPNLLASHTHNGVIYTVNADGSITLGGTATSEGARSFHFYLPSGSYIYTSDISESFSTYDTYILKSGTTIARGSSIAPGHNFTLTEYSDLVFNVRVRNGVSPNVTIKPLIRLSSVVDATYEPYKEHIYPLNPALELRGIPKLNSSNKLYYDGDIYSSDGSVIRKYGVIDLGSFDWKYFSSTNKMIYGLFPQAKKPTSANERANILCEIFETISRSEAGYAPPYTRTGIGMDANGNLFIQAPNSTWTDVPSAVAEITGYKLIYELATPVIESTSGLIDNVSIASFDDGADDQSVNLLSSEIVAVESGNGQPKSPSNPYTISGFDSGIVTRCGKNLFDGSKVTTTNTSNWGVSYDSSTNILTIEHKTTYGSGMPKFDIPSFVGDLVISGNFGATIDLYMNGSWVRSMPSGVSFTCTSGNKYSLLFPNNSQSTLTYKVQLEIGDTSSEFEQYNGNTYTFAFGQTVYGGHFDNNGNLVVTHGYKDLGTLNYTMYSVAQGNLFRSDEFDIKRVTQSTEVPNIISSIFVAASNASRANYTISMVNGSARIDIVDNDYSDANAFKTAMSGVQLVYELVNPITLSITSQDIPTLLGENNVFSNTGNIKSLSYPKQVCPFEQAQEVDDHGTEEYIDNREVAIPVGHESKYFTAGKIYNFLWLDEAGLIKEGELNADTGVLTITDGYGIVDLGDLTWSYNISRVAFNVQITDIKTVSSGTIGNMSCSIYTVSPAISSASDAANKPDMTIFQQKDNASVFIKNSSFTDTATFKSAMHGVKLLYELANPVRTIQLTPVQVESLIGHNVLISESGNISVTPRTYSTYTEKMNAISDWLHSASGYARLEDTYEPDYYRKAYYDEQTDMENIFDEAGRATLKFICKPQRYLKSGEEPITISSGGPIQNRTRYEAYPILKVTTNNTQGSVAIGNHSITIKAGAGTDPITIDCELQDAWSGTTNKNSFIVLTDGEFPVIDPGTQTVTFDGGVQSVEVIPRWWTV